MDPITGAIITGGAAVGASLLKPRRKRSKRQKQKDALIDDLIASVRGEGPFTDLFEMDEAAFQKSVVDPAMSRFKNQTAPQIQQSFVASGQHRGTALDDTLTRAGVDLDQLINQQYLEFQSQGRDRKGSAIDSILNQGDGPERKLSTGDKVREGGAAFLTGDSFEERLDRILDSASRGNSQNRRRDSSREGFE